MADYVFSTNTVGTSFAAPQISGLAALLLVAASFGGKGRAWGPPPAPRTAALEEEPDPEALARTAAVLSRISLRNSVVADLIDVIRTYLK